MFTEKRRHFANKRFTKETNVLNDYIELIDMYASEYGNDVYAFAYEFYSHHEPHSTRGSVYSRLMSYLESKLVEEA